MIRLVVHVWVCFLCLKNKTAQIRQSWRIRLPCQPQVRTWTCVVAQVIGLNKLETNRGRKKGRIEGERQENLLGARVN